MQQRKKRLRSQIAESQVCLSLGVSALSEVGIEIQEPEAPVREERGQEVYAIPC